DRLTVLLEECRNMDLPVLPPDVDESAPDFAPTPEGIRFGLSAIKNVREGAAQAIFEARADGGRFADLFDLCQRLDLKAVNRRVVESLIAAGAVDRPSTHRAQMLESLDLVLRNAQIFNEQKLRGQRSLFDDAGNMAARVDKPSLPETAEWSQSERLERERELLGFYVSSHPLNEHARDLRFFATPIGKLERYADGASVRIGGLITRVSTSTDRRGQSIAFATIEDQGARTDVVFFSDAYANFRSLIEQGQAVLAEGRVSRRNGNLGLQAESLIPLAEARQKLTKAVNFVLKLDDESSSDLLQRLRRLVEQHTGNCELLIHLRNGSGNDAVVRSRSLRVNPSDELLKAVGTLIEPEKPWLTEAPNHAKGVPARA
ncbi:MAG: OB-fold nucleic acid binding domain-containing protein, partial [Gemmatimonadetes bacterium]|nr:OB-fold nucleic acid binding domain-containing protein [Gemmatimonadota bacterium]